MSADDTSRSWPDGYEIVEVETIDSTNAEVLRRAAAGATGPLWLRADEQTSGRGRRGRAWTSVPGNHYASLLLTIEGSPASLTELGFVTGLAIHDTLADVLDGTARSIAIKWPNDILIDGAKVSGLLLESSGTGTPGRWAVAVGIGINIASHPEGTPYDATHVNAHGVTVTPSQVFARLVRAFATWHREWRSGGGFAPVLEAWKARAAGIGAPVRVDFGDRVLVGRFRDIDRHGALILETSGGEDERILAGDLFLAGGANAKGH